MLASKSALFGVIALLGSASSQVVVTVTNTITVITVTVTPLSTSTSTIWTTIAGSAPSSSSTSTETITVTWTPPSVPSSACPIPLYGQCGGSQYNGACRGYCAKGSTCKYQNAYYSQCQQSKFVETVVVPVYQAIEA